MVIGIRLLPSRLGLGIEILFLIDGALSIDEMVFTHDLALHILFDESTIEDAVGVLSFKLNLAGRMIEGAESMTLTFFQRNLTYNLVLRILDDPNAIHLVVDKLDGRLERACKF